VLVDPQQEVLTGKGEKRKGRSLNVTGEDSTPAGERTRVGVGEIEGGNPFGRMWTVKSVRIEERLVYY